MKLRRELVQDYVKGSEKLGEFFQHDFRLPPDPDFVDKVAERPDSALIDEIRSYNKLLGADERTMENIEALRERDTVAVVTGQQPGIFTGPLYTIYKALAAVQLSKRNSATLERKVVPVFWVASDDHDFEEIRTIRFIDWRGHIRALSLTVQDHATELSAFRIPADRGRLSRLIQTLDEETTDFEEKWGIVAALKDTLGKDKSLAGWFGRLLLELFRGTGLVIFLPHKARARNVAAEVLAAEIRSPGTTTGLIREISTKLATMGYAVQVEKKPNETHFFLYANGKRRKVLFERDRYYVPDENASFSKGEMEEICSREPERFSPNVVLRTVVQGSILPTLDYVAGPGEIAYWVQLRPVFERFGVPMARVYPRPHVLLVNRRSAKLIQRHSIDLAQLAVANQAVIGGRPPNTPSSPQEETVAKSAGRIMSEFNRYVAGISAFDASLGASAAKLRQKIGREVARLNEKTLAVHRQRTEQVQNEIEELRANLFPSRKPQERVFNILPYLMESGWALIPRLLRDVDIERTDYQTVII